MGYTSYDFYRQKYFGESVSETEFPKWNEKASDKGNVKVKIYTMLYILYPDLEKMPVRLYQEAAEQANWFIDAGTQDDEGENVRKMDWTQDEPIIFPAVNAVAGRETRAEK